MHAIPTVYAGVRFRSRLEARWAAFFDVVGWRWDYEPIDLNGYIPDFYLRFHEPVLVEVKPVYVRTFEQDRATFLAEAEKRHTALGEAFDQTHQLLLGAALLPVHGSAHAFGIGVQSRWIDPIQARALGRVATTAPARRGFYGQVHPFLCSSCGHRSLFLLADDHIALAEQCFVCGAERPSGAGRAWNPLTEWREAGNRVQWKPARASRPVSAAHTTTSSDSEFARALEAANGRLSTAESPGAYCSRCGYPTGSDAIAEIDYELGVDPEFGGYEVRHVDREQCRANAIANGAPPDEPGAPPG